MRKFDYRMLQLQVIRQKPDWVKERLAIKNFDQLELIDELIKLDNERKNYQFQEDELRARIRLVSKEIEQLMAKGEKEKAEEKKKEVKDLKSVIFPGFI